MVKKCEIRKCLIGYVLINTREIQESGTKGVPVLDEIFLDGDAPSQKNLFTFAFVTDVPAPATTVFTLVDACQLLKNLPFIEQAHNRWSDIIASMNKKLTAYGTCIKSIPSTVQTQTVAMFDNAKYGSRAKRHTQNERRVDMLIRELKKAEKDDRIVEIPSRSAFKIQHHDFVPRSWEIVSIVPAYKSEFIQFLEANIDERIASVHDVNDKSSKYANIGEFDHYFMRFIVEEHTKTEAHHVFNVISSDTDIILYALYLLEYLEHDVGRKRLPDICVVAPDYSKRTHITKLYHHLKAMMSPHEHYCKRTMVRSFCVAMIVSGNDNIPSVYAVVPDQFFGAFIEYRRLFGAPVVQYTSDDQTGMLRVNGKAVIMLHLLAYARKYLTEKHDLKVIEQLSLDQIYKWISTEVSRTNKDARKHVLSIQSLQSRLESLILSFYALEHAIMNVPDHDTASLNDIELPELCFYNYYHTIPDTYRDHENNVLFRLHECYKCISYTRHLLPVTTKSAEAKMTEVLKLIATRIKLVH